MLGLATSTGLMVRVGGTTPFQRVRLRRLDGAVASTGTAPVMARPIIAAGFDLPRGTETPKTDPVDADGHPHDEAAWRTRHLPRSILKDASPIVVLTDDEAESSGRRRRCSGARWDRRRISRRRCSLISRSPAR